MSANHADEIRKHLAAWDAGQIVPSIEMGGLGPGYEQTIQILAIEIMRDNPAAPSEKQWRNFGDATVRRIDCRRIDGTYAQVEASKNIAAMFLRHGIEAAIEKAPQDRLIWVSRFWPEAPKPLGKSA